MYNKLVFSFLMLLSALFGEQYSVSTNSAMSTNSLFKLILIFAIVFGLFYFLKFFLKTPLTSTNKNLKIIEKLPLDLRSAIYLIELNGKYFLIANSDRPLSLLDSFGKQKPQVKFLENESFDKILKRITKKVK